MGWTKIGVAQGFDSGSVTTVASNQNSGQTLNVAVGDLLFVAVGYFVVGSPTVVSIVDSVGNTFILIDTATGTDGGSGDPYTVEIYRCVVTTAIANDVVTLTLSSAQIQKGIVVHQFRADTTFVLDQHDIKVDSIGAGSITTDAFTTTKPSSVIFFAAHRSWGESAGFYNVGDIGGTPATFDANGVTDTWGLAVEYRIVTTIQSGITAAMSADVSGTWQSAFASFGEEEAPPAANLWLPQGSGIVRGTDRILSSGMEN